MLPKTRLDSAWIIFRVHPIMHEYSKSYTPFGTKMQSQNEFHLQPNSLFARNLHWFTFVVKAKRIRQVSLLFPSFFPLRSKEKNNKEITSVRLDVFFTNSLWYQNKQHNQGNHCVEKKKNLSWEKQLCKFRIFASCSCWLNQTSWTAYISLAPTYCTGTATWKKPYTLSK